MPSPSLRQLGPRIGSVLLWLGSVTASLPVRAADAVPKAPILRIEAGMHTAVVRHFAVDRAGRYLVSVSEDISASA